MEPVVEKAQQDPHYPWSLTSVTIFLSLQSMSTLSATSWVLVRTFGVGSMRQADLNSSQVRSENLFTPTEKLLVFYKVFIFQRLSLKTLKRYKFSYGVLQNLPKFFLKSLNWDKVDKSSLGQEVRYRVRNTVARAMDPRITPVNFILLIVELIF